ncbi:MAG: Ni/Fe hydrogenase subunit alpha [Gammaproteobacteria bacterium]
MSRSVSIRVPALTRVEGEGALELDVRDGRIDHLALKIFEPPRYFEKLLEGRPATDVIDAVARICGICPVAYQMSAAAALEQALGVEINDWARDMRRLFYCGEWIQSHALHVHLLAAPDFLGFGSVIEMAAEHGDLVRRGLRLQSFGNALIALLGGRSVHPVGACIGGFSRAPREDEVAALLARAEQAVEDAEALARWAAGVALPDDRQTFTRVALEPTDGAYPMMGTRLGGSGGLSLDVVDWPDRFSEFHRPHSTALFCDLDGEPYLVGPLARVALYGGNLRPEARDLLGRIDPDNMFHSLRARCAELQHAVLEARDLLRNYRTSTEPHVPVSLGPGVGRGASEAPRGLLWHRYELDERGRVVSARIVPPTSQNQGRMEQDLRQSLERFGLGADEDALRLRAETVIRNYDPCISCATHFLTLRVRR